jgi:UDPglucose--hexose-1-phosphate uridylyltransferase
MKEVTVRYDNLFQTSFPYSMGVYQAPTDDQNYKFVGFHQSFFPPLLRSATVRKFMVGYELCCEPQRDILPEQAAGMLRECSSTHYKLL